MPLEGCKGCKLPLIEWGRRNLCGEVLLQGGILAPRQSKLCVFLFSLLISKIQRPFTVEHFGLNGWFMLVT